MPQNPPTHADHWDNELFILQGANRAELLAQVCRLDEFLASHPDIRLVDLAYAINSQLTDSELRLGMVAASSSQLRRHLQRAKDKLDNPKCLRIRDVTGLYFAAEPLYRQGGLAFLFPGEASQYPGMLAGVPASFREARDVLARCERLAASAGDLGSGLLQRLVEAPPNEPHDNPRQVATMDQSRAGSLSADLFSVVIGNWIFSCVAELLGLEACAVAGHSAGELSALCHAGVLQSDEEIIALAKETHLMDEKIGRHQEPAGLLALGTSREKAAAILADANLPRTAAGEPTAYVAMDNCPHQCVVVGVPQAIERIEELLQQQHVIYERLVLDRPYHTRLFEPLTEPLRQMFAEVHFESPRRKIYSCTTGEPFPLNSDEIRKLTVEHWVSTVEFTRLIQRMYEDGARLFLEVGPRGNLSAFVEDILRGRPAEVVPINVPRISPLAQLNHMAARLSVHCVPMELSRLYAERHVRDLAWPADRPATQPPSNRQDEMTTTANVSAPATPPATAEQPAAALPPTSLPPTSLSTTQLGARAPQATDDKSQVVSRYQTIMRQFLQTQEEVMRGFLSSNLRNRRRRGKVDQGASRRTHQQTTTAPPIKAPPTRRQPLLGELQLHEPGRRLVMRRRLELAAEPYADQHTVGGQRISHVDPHQHGLPVMPMTFTLETMAAAAAVLLPGMVVVALRNVRLQRWLAFYVEDPVSIELTAQVVPRDKAKAAPDQFVVQVEICDLGNSGTGPGAHGGPAATGEIVLAPSYPAPPPRPAEKPFELTNPRPFRITLKNLYDNLFHGPLFQGVHSLDTYGDREVVGTVEVLPRQGLFADDPEPGFLLDPVTLDTAMHPLAAWHLEQPDQAGRIMLPFALDRVEFFQSCPQVGAQFVCRGRLRKETPRYVVHELDVVDAADKLCWTMSGIRLWRFYLPFEGVNFHGPKDIYYLSKEWPAAVAGDSGAPRAACVRLQAPADLTQPAILWAAGKVMLSPREQREFAALDGSDEEKADWLFRRASCKDAVRKLFLKTMNKTMFVADIEVVTSAAGWSTRPRDAFTDIRFPQVAVAHADGHFVAMAAFGGTPGVAVASLSGAALDQTALLSDAERVLSARLGNEENEAILRLHCAKQAVANSLGAAANANVVNELGIQDVARDGTVHLRMPNGKCVSVTTTSNEHIVVGSVVRSEGPGNENE